MTNYRWLLIAALISGGGLPEHAHSDEATLEQRLRALEQEVQTLKVAHSPAGLHAPAPNTPSSNPPGGEAFAGRSGFTLQSPDGDFMLRLGGLIQLDGRFYTGNGANTSAYVPATAGSVQTDQFLLRRVRPILSGVVFQNYYFFLQPDFGGNTAAIYDAYLDLRPWSYASLRLGKFKPPLGLERLQTDSDLAFTERGLTSDLIPQRDTGLEFFGGLWNNALTYQASFTNGVADGAFTPDSDSNNAKVGSFRFFVQPFHNTSAAAWQGLGLGVAGGYTGNNSLLPTYKTANGQQTFFTYAAGTSLNGEQSHLIPQANYYWKAVGLYGEYAQTNQVAQTGLLKTRLTNHAWQAAASWVLTGENSSYTGVAPARNFDPRAGTWGAWELAARVHQVQIDPETFRLGFANPATAASRATAYTLGLNWYLNRFLKLVTDYEETWFKGGNGTGDRPIERVISFRSQIAF